RPSPTLFPYTTLFRSIESARPAVVQIAVAGSVERGHAEGFPVGFVGQLQRRKLRIDVLGILLRGYGMEIVAAECLVKRVRNVDRSEEHTSELQSRSDL